MGSSPISWTIFSLLNEFQLIRSWHSNQTHSFCMYKVKNSYDQFAGLFFFSYQGLPLRISTTPFEYFCIGKILHAAQSRMFFLELGSTTSPPTHEISKNQASGNRVCQIPSPTTRDRQTRKYTWILIVDRTVLQQSLKISKHNRLIVNSYKKVITIYKMLKTLLLIMLIASTMSKSAPGCQHPIFCNDTILTAVANSNYFADSKTFVDLTLTVSIQEAINQFNTKPVTSFLQNCFTQNDSVLEPVQLPDWTEKPQSLSHITKPQLQAYALDLNKRWNELSRKVNLNYTTGCKIQCNSFLPNMNGRTIVVPGGRFMESYYWDTYWIIKGLIASDLLQTAQTLIENFVLAIEKYGFIPNGFRQYYLNRSQPPFFSLMVKQVVEAYRKKGFKNKADALQEFAFAPLVQEHQFFMSSHARAYRLKSQKEIKLNFYNAETTTPRPESFKEDMNLVQNVTSETAKRQILKSVSTMAESGWDFSSRWLTNVTDLKTSVILDMFPSDLNTLMALGEAYLSTLALKFGRTDLYYYYQKCLNDRKQYFLEKFNGKIFPDHSPLRPRNDSELYPSDYYPFMLFASKEPSIPQDYRNVVNPTTSVYKNGMQWDNPNVWAPNNWIMHEVLNDRDAFQFAKQWVSTTYCSWKLTGDIYQKYLNTKLGERGYGGEYTVQTGFGWTNGLALYYLKLYGDELTVPTC